MKPITCIDLLPTFMPESQEGLKPLGKLVLIEYFSAALESQEGLKLLVCQFVALQRRLDLPRISRRVETQHAIWADTAGQYVRLLESQEGLKPLYTPALATTAAGLVATEVKRRPRAKT